MSEKNNEDKLLRVGHVAKRLDVSDKTIYRWLDEGKIFNAKKIVRIGVSPRIPESEVNNALNGNPFI
ncbi:MAG: helix-turn-helix domain-containing protein [Thermodesulfovibrionia bacterium]|nr:helix-turn-helix domain-containing protein [Thermodesulfovibrionia bacterium]